MREKLTFIHGIACYFCYRAAETQGYPSGFGWLNRRAMGKPGRPDDRLPKHPLYR
jgi:hypothetical protein